MIPMGSRRRGRCTVTFSASVVFAVVSTVSCGTILLQQTPAQDRGGGGGGFFDNLFTNPFASAPSTPAYNVPDVAGFGMYPLWKFHKFDGLSLRPVPYGVDIGTGLPPVPSPPTYPTGFIPAPNQATPAAPQKTNYGPPASPPATNYEPAPPAPSYASASPPAQPSYGSSAPPQNHQVLNYQLSGVQYQQAQDAAPPANNYGSSQAPLNIAYSPAAPAQGGYNAPSAPSYGEQQGAPVYGGNSGPTYGNPVANPGYTAPMGYDSVQYGSGNGNGITIQFSPQDYGMQQSGYGNAGAGSYQMPTYTAIESPMSAYPSMQDAGVRPMEQGYGGGGFLKRSSYLPENDSSKNVAEVLSDVNFNSQQ